ncbi:MAG: glycosyltransferase family 2 protein [Acidobacteriota bacterium]
MVPSDPPHIAILLCTYQGALFLPAQLDSFATQTRQDWAVWASDDGSADGTLELLEQYRQRWGSQRLTLVSGPRRGITANFISLLCRQDIRARAYACADQDDIWEPEKLARASRWIDQVDAAVPALYCSRTRLIDATGHETGMSPLFLRPPSFAAALAQNIAGGNTMVVNEAARQLVVRAAAAGAEPVLYDWWIYLVVTACGGRVYYDPVSTLRYRQHGQNEIGANTRLSDRADNAVAMLRGRVRRWNDTNLAALDRIADLITPGNRRLLDTFRDARTRGVAGRVTGLYRSGVRRQTFVGNVGLFVAAAAGRI